MPLLLAKPWPCQPPQPTLFCRRIASKNGAVLKIKATLRTLRKRLSWPSVKCRIQCLILVL
uniref:Uncharacterized protein n=1 Tax=Arundo donax TaxID=35708 RepID=A0A0A8ZWV3_ARUDO